METFFDITKGRDRMITFAGNLRRDFKLLEVSEAILEEIKITGYAEFTLTPSPPLHPPLIPPALHHCMLWKISRFLL